MKKHFGVFDLDDDPYECFYITSNKKKAEKYKNAAYAITELVDEFGYDFVKAINESIYKDCFIDFRVLEIVVPVNPPKRNYQKR